MTGLFFKPHTLFAPTTVAANTRIRMPRAPGRLFRPGSYLPSAPGADYTQQAIHKLTLDLGLQRTLVPQYISGTILWMYRVFNQADGTPNTTAQLSVRIGDITADDLTWYAGNGVEGISYNRVFFTNPVQAGISAEIAYFLDTAAKPVRFF